MPRFICGYLSAKSDRSLIKFWNKLFTDRNIDAYFDFYRTSATDLDLRLSEMFLLERRGYIIGKEHQEALIPLLDQLDTSAKTMKKVNVVLNKGGVLGGYWIEDAEEQLKVWMP